jgi:hypothetical protein
MKSNDILLYGGIAVAAYLLFFKKTATTPALTPVSYTPVKPVYQTLPTQPNVATSVVSALAALAPQAIKLFNNSATPQPTGSQIIDTSTVQDSIDNISAPPPFLSSQLVSYGTVSGPGSSRLAASLGIF